MYYVQVYYCIVYFIVERYTGSGRDERRVNFGTMRKKVRRLQQTLTVMTGLRSAVSNNNDITYLIYSSILYFILDY